MARDWQQLYALQDRVLAWMDSVTHGFYLGGGTALARGYCHHRYSEDLDFFTNDAPEFGLWRDRCLDALRREGLEVMPAIEQAGGKAAGVFPPLVAERLTTALSAGVPKVFWMQPPEPDRFNSDLRGVIQRILE